jgi:MoaA/NifB/PqqE/SkfB family radical SAM enzyme
MGTDSGQVRSGRILSKILCIAAGNIFNSIINKFPDTVQIETTNACNSKCIICPHKRMGRTIKTMDDDIFMKVIDECAKYKCGNVHLHNFGEPLLDKKIIQRIKYAKDKGLQRVKIFSNGSLLTAEMSENLVTAGLDEIKISFDGANKEEYEKIRYPLKFDSVVNNINTLVSIRNKRQSSLKIEIACSSTSDKSATMESLENCVDKFSFGKLHNWGDSEVTYSESSKTRKPCSRIWRTFTVLSNGKSSLCCLDYDGKVILGDLHESSISEIWRNSQYKSLRKCHTHALQNKISICSNCSKAFI